MNLLTPSFDFKKALSTNSTDASFDSLVPTTTEPSEDDGAVSFSGVASANGQAHNTVLVLPYGVGGDDTTFDMRVVGWTKIETLWVPVPIVGIQCILSTAVGVASAAVTNNERFADTITEVLAPDSAVFYSTTGNRIAWFMFDAMGFQKIQFSFDMTGATSGNALYRRL